jgi:hypothetical protein
MQDPATPAVRSRINLLGDLLSQLYETFVDLDRGQCNRLVVFELPMAIRTAHAAK